MSTVKPVILEDDGIFGQLRNGAIINAGGTSFPTFTVGGRGLLFDDGSSSGGTSIGLTLQQVYDNSIESNGGTGITLSNNKDFIINDSLDNANIFFKIDSETGAVTISGDLIVKGSTVTIDSTIQSADHWLIQPIDGLTNALAIEPAYGVVPLVDLLTVRRTFGTNAVFRIDSGGNLYSTKNLTIQGLINNKDIVTISDKLDAHITETDYFHTAEKITVAPITTLPGATNVQNAIEALNTKIDTGVAVANVRGYEHNETTPSNIWVIQHNLQSFRISPTVYNTTFRVIIPNDVEIIDANTIKIYFITPQDGKAMILAF